MRNRSPNSLAFVFTYLTNFSESVLRTVSAKLNTEPNPIVIIMRKKSMHQSWGAGMSESASG